MINNDMIHFISSRDHIGSLILTSLAFYHCLRPSVPSLAQASPPRGPSLQSLPTCPSRLQPVHQAKSCLDLLHLDHMTQCYVLCAMSSFIITCVSYATSLSHFHLHGICYSHTCTYGLITCVSHIKTISPPRVVTQLSKPNKDLSPQEDRLRQKGIAILGHAVGYKKKAKALRLLPSRKASKGVFYSSAGLGATVGY